MVKTATAHRPDRRARRRRGRGRGNSAAAASTYRASWRSCSGARRPVLISTTVTTPSAGTSVSMVPCTSSPCAAQRKRHLVQPFAPMTAGAPPPACRRSPRSGRRRRRMTTSRSATPALSAGSRSASARSASARGSAGPRIAHVLEETMDQGADESRRIALPHPVPASLSGGGAPTADAESRTCTAHRRSNRSHWRTVWRPPWEPGAQA